jgi:hypothetical protein
LIRRTELRLGLAVIAAGLVCRVLFSFFIIPAWERQANVATTPDQYSELARSLIERGTLGFLEGSPETTTARGPGFPLWLVPGLLVGGEDPRWLGLWAGLPGLLAAGWVAAAAARRYGGAGALVAGVIAACHPLPLLVSGRVMSDEFYAALGWGAIAAWVAARETCSPRAGRLWIGLGALLLGWQIVTRANGVLTLAAIAAVSLASLPWRRRAGGAPAPAAFVVPVVPVASMASLALMAFIALVPALAWSARTSRLEGRPVFVHSLFWYNFWVGEAIDRVGADPVRGDLSDARQKIIADAAGMPEMGSPYFWWGQLTPRQTAKLERRLQAAAVRRILADPLSYLARCALGAVHFWIRAETRARTLQYAPLVLPVLILMTAGAVRTLKPGAPADPLARIAALAIALHCVAFAMVLPMARLSVQIYPCAAYLAGAGAAAGLGRLFGRGRP